MAKSRHQKIRSYALEALTEQGGVCIYCDDPLTPETMTADHLIPKSAGGGNDRGNIAACCERCNRCKGSLGPFTYQHLVRNPEDRRDGHPLPNLALENFRYRVNKRVKQAERAIRRAAR